MKRTAMLVMALSLLSLPLAEVFGDPVSDGIALGIYGAGSQWSIGNPTLRYRVSPSEAVDLTPSVVYRNGSRVGLHYHSYEAGLELGWVPTIHRHERALLGLRVALGGVREIEKSESTRYATYDLDLSVGPDMEYFLTSVPGLSIGTHGVVRVRREWTSKDGFAHGYTFVELLGQLLTIRYYF